MKVLLKNEAAGFENNIMGDGWMPTQGIISEKWLSWECIDIQKQEISVAILKECLKSVEDVGWNWTGKMEHTFHTEKTDGNPSDLFNRLKQTGIF